MDARKKIKTDINRAETAEERHKLEDKLQQIEKGISDECEEKHLGIIKEQVQGITQKDGATNNAGVWRLRKNIFPKATENFSAKKDKEGNLVSNPERLKEVFIDAYVDRLKHREIIPELLKLKTLREELFQQRLELSKLNKSPEWTMKELDKVLDHLQKQKATDPIGLVNELFMCENIGEDLKKSLLLMMNKIKRDFKEPEFMSMANVTSLWKGKGPKDDIDSDRGIFIYWLYCG